MAASCYRRTGAKRKGPDERGPGVRSNRQVCECLCGSVKSAVRAGWCEAVEKGDKDSGENPSTAVKKSSTARHQSATLTEVSVSQNVCMCVCVCVCVCERVMGGVRLESVISPGLRVLLLC